MNATTAAIDLAKNAFQVTIVRGTEPGIEKHRLSHALYVRAYVRRSKTDRADARALLEAVKDPDIRPVRAKSIEQKALQALNRTRSLWMATRTTRINALRGFCREFGLHVSVGTLHFASRFGLTPKESSSGNHRHLGRISKRGDEQLRMLLTHGARPGLYAAGAAAARGTRLSGIRD